ncbi:MAG: MATE family efflux transporter, partial [Eubacteriaceae bacterium]|nr:MATE family efflux transporter [Eubacteriaceae bacterium]
FMGFAVFSSDFFTALNDGLTSALISFLRTLVFESLSILILPLIFGVEGIWLSVVVAELMAVVLGTLFLVIKRKKFHYW